MINNNLLYTQNFAKTTDLMLCVFTTTVKKNKTNKEWIKSALPSEEIIYQRTIGTAGEKKAKEKIEAGMEHFINSLIESLKKGLRK